MIDDNEIDNFINKSVVANEQIAEMITVKSSPIDALHYLDNKESNFPELILLDIKMPVMSGFEFLDEFSKFTEDKKKQCVIVMLSSSHNNTDIEAAKENIHVKEFLVKPLNNIKLNEVLKKLF